MNLRNGGDRYVNIMGGDRVEIKSGSAAGKFGTVVAFAGSCYSGRLVLVQTGTSSKVTVYAENELSPCLGDLRA